MILDDLIALFVSIFVALFEGVAAVFIPVVNFFALVIEAVVGIFVTGFSLGRLGRKGETRRGPGVVGLVLVVMIAAVVVGTLVVPRVMSRTVTLVAEDGRSLPYAGVVVRTDEGARHERTNRKGEIVVPRFSIASLTVKDVRYVERTWEKPEIRSELTVGRSVLGSGVDKVAQRLLEAAAE